MCFALLHHCGMSTFFFFNDTATTEIYTLSLHDALPICIAIDDGRDAGGRRHPGRDHQGGARAIVRERRLGGHVPGGAARSEEHTSELQSHLNLVCRLLLEKKKKQERYSNLVVCTDS